MKTSGIYGRFPYALLSVGSLLLYGATGFLAASYWGAVAGGLAAGIVGLVSGAG